MNSTYCPLIFHGIYSERLVTGKQSISPCCLARKSEPFLGEINFANNEYLEEIRQASRDGKKHAACINCWTLEENGGESKRQVSIDQYKDMDLPLDESIKLYNLDYNTLPICNAKCVICSPRYSSLWAVDAGHNIKNLLTQDYNHLASLDLSNIKIVYFNGGEPLLTKEHLTVLKKIDKISEVDIFYNTNGSCYPTAEVVDIWSKARQVSIYFSIDGIGKRFEETRTPLKWDLVSENIKKINLLDNINIQCSYVIGRHNVYDLEDTINWFATLPNFDPLTMFQVHCVNPGHKLAIHRASAEEKELFKKELYKFNKFHWYNSIGNYII